MSDGTMIKYTALKPFKGSSEQPTVHLRWCGGKLQQKWSITEYAGSSPASRRAEWRDVPTDDSDAVFPTATSGTGGANDVA